MGTAFVPRDGQIRCFDKSLESKYAGAVDEQGDIAAFGGQPGGIDRATFGNPGKVGFCLAEDESDPEWTPLAQARGIAAGASAVTLFHGDGVTGFIDQKSRTPESLSKSLAMSLIGVGHPKLAEWCNAILLLSPEHYAIYRDAGWDRARIEEALHEATTRPAAELARDVGGVGEGMELEEASGVLPKFWRDHGLLIARAGGPAGSTAARELASRGVDVLLLERAKFPRDKPCGGGVTIRCDNLLPFSLDPVIEDVITGAVIQLRDGKPRKQGHHRPGRQGRNQ